MKDALSIFDPIPEGHEIGGEKLAEACLIIDVIQDSTHDDMLERNVAYKLDQIRAEARKLKYNQFPRDPNCLVCMLTELKERGGAQMNGDGVGSVILSMSVQDFERSRVTRCSVHTFKGEPPTQRPLIIL